jgi:4-hydroxybenzoate polyprenyltransferase
VSNLPTVWSNVLVGVVLAGRPVAPFAIVALAAALSLFYIGGMFLNDAFDHAIDARERPERPIPAGIVSARDVFLTGSILMALGWIGVVWVASMQPLDDVVLCGASGIALAGTIVLYNAWHKGVALSPAIMGLCRVLVYVTAYLAISPFSGTVLAVASGVLFAYLIGLTYVAKQEKRASLAGAWPLAVLAVPVAYGVAVAFRRPIAAIFAVGFDAWLSYALSYLVVPKRFNGPRGVVALLAGISLLDALIVAAAGRPDLALFAVAAWAATRYLQRYVAGT